MERIDRRTQNLVPLMARLAVCPLMRSKVRAYSHQGHGPRADQQAGYISATSDSTPSVAKSSRSIHLGHPGHLNRLGGMTGVDLLPDDAVSAGRPGICSEERWPHQIGGATRSNQSSTCSAMLRASSTSIPR